MQQQNKPTPVDRHLAIDGAIGLVFLVIFLAAAFAYGRFLSKVWMLYPVVLAALLMAYMVYMSKTPKRALLGLVGVAMTGLLIHVLAHKGLQGSALFYIGLPLLLTLCMCLQNKDRERLFPMMRLNI